MGNSLHISFDVNRTTLLSLGLSAAAHIAAICGLATMVVTPSQVSLGSAANSNLAIDIPLHQDQTRPKPPPPATQKDLERLLAKIPPEKVKAQEEAEDLPLTLGVDDGKSNTKAWMGFSEATKHQAQQSVVEQSALTRDAGNPGESAIQNTPQLEPSVDHELSPSGVERTEITEQQAIESKGSADRGDGKDSADRQKREAQEAVSELKAAPGTPAITSAMEFLQRLVQIGANGIAGSDEKSRDRKDKIDASVESHIGAKTQEERLRSDAGNQGAEAKEAKKRATSASGGESKLPGLEDDRDSEATSITEPVDLIVNGKVQAAKGLRIRTVQAEFSTTTRLTARPRSPQVLITFNRTGKVVRATFAPGRSTGFDDVDQPLLNSIYRWTAKGETLLRLSATNPRAELTITVNILFQ